MTRMKSDIPIYSESEDWMMNPNQLNLFEETPNKTECSTLKIQENEVQEKRIPQAKK